MLFVDYLQQRSGWVSLKQVVDDLGLPRRFLAQIASKLVHAGLIESKEGVSGGYKLKKTIDKISLYDFLKVFEGDLRLVKCTSDTYECRFEHICSHKRHWKNTLKKQFIQMIGDMSIAQALNKNYVKS